MKLRTILEGVGSALLLLPYYPPFFDFSGLVFYHHGLPVTHVIGGALVDILVVSLLITGFLVGIQHLPQVAQEPVYAVFSGFMLWRIVNDAIVALSNLNYPSDFWYRIRWQCCIATLLLTVALSYFLPHATQFVAGKIRLVIAGFSFCALWVIPALVSLMIAGHPYRSAPTLQESNWASSIPNRRIVWILLDELSYSQAFDHKASGIELPNLERLRDRSVSFSHLRPVGYLTEDIVPSLFLGRGFNQIRSSDGQNLWDHDRSQGRWIEFDPQASLFGLAKRNGWTSGIDGWYNPYCHLLASVLDVCSWEPLATPALPLEFYGASEEKSVLADAASMPNEMMARLHHTAATLADSHLLEYRVVMQRTRGLIEAGKIRFVFIHMPVPHPPGIYDRRKHVLRAGGTYLDNLVLADDTLGTLSQEIDATPSAGQTTVIVSSDHSWRIPMWRGHEFWSDEEERASGGRFDDRPVLLIHFPGQQAGKSIDAPVPELLEHDMIAGMLRGEIDNPQELETFLAKQGY